MAIETPTQKKGGEKEPTHHCSKSESKIKEKPIK